MLKSCGWVCGLGDFRDTPDQSRNSSLTLGLDLGLGLGLVNCLNIIQTVTIIQ